MEIASYWPTLTTVAIIAVGMSISPGQDFALVTRNALVVSRRAGLYASAGIAAAIWLHVVYSIAGIALIIQKSQLLFSIIKYLGAAYLLYLGLRGLRARAGQEKPDAGSATPMSDWAAFRTGFFCNALNPKTTLFFLSIFTQVVTPHTPIGIQLIYGLEISTAHLLWFSLVAVFFSAPALVRRIQRVRPWIERTLGAFLCAFAVKVALSTSRS